MIKIGKYKLSESMIWEGPKSKVYQALDDKNNTVAVKEIKIS